MTDQDNILADVLVYLGHLRAEASTDDYLSKKTAYDLIRLEISDFLRREREEKQSLGNEYKPFRDRIRQYR